MLCTLLGETYGQKKNNDLPIECLFHELWKKNEPTQTYTTNHMLHILRAHISY